MEIDQIQPNDNFPIISNGFGRLVPTKMDEQNPDEEERANIRRATNNTALGGVGRFNGWPSSRIVRVSRASGGKDRHSKVLTSKGLRDRRVRLSVTTAIQFYDLQDRLGVDQPSKAVEWLLKAAAASITDLPPMNSPFLDTPEQLSDNKRNSSTAGNDLLAFESGEVDMDGGDTSYFLRQQMPTKSSACSSNSENRKGSALSLSRSESWLITGEQAKKRDADKKKVKENESSYVASFTELLGGGINSINSNGDNGRSVRQNPRHWSSDNYFNTGVLGPPATRPRPNFTFALAAGGNGGGGEHNPNFTISSANNSSSGVAAFNRGTLQSNSSPPPSLLPHNSIQRFNPPSDGSSQHFFLGGGAENHHHFLSGFDGGLQLYYGDTDAHSNKGKLEKN